MKEFFQHTAMTDGVTVRVAVNFLPEQSRIEAGKWFWVYHIRIENDSDETLQLMTRHWRITDGHGDVSMVDGEATITSPVVLCLRRKARWKATTPSCATTAPR